MSETPGWRPLQKHARKTRAGGQAAASTATTAATALVGQLPTAPFARMARTHLLSTGGDAMIAVALAGSIFFSIEPDAARWRVTMYLLLTIAPFAIVTPLIGPALDRVRGGRRSMIVGAALARATIAFLMVSHIDSLLLFPLAFSLLVVQKAYSVSKSAVVPKLVESNRQLVEGNSKLALISAVGSMGGAAAGAMLTFVGGSSTAAAFAIFAYLAAALSALQLPPVAVAIEPPEPAELAELRSAGIVLAGSAMSILRGAVGFAIFLLAFELRGGKEGVHIDPEGAAVGASTALGQGVDIVGDPGAPGWHYGAVVAAAGLGGLLGARIAPWLRRQIAEERILLGVLGVTVAGALIAAWQGDLSGAMTIALMTATAAAGGKLAFDSIVQRDAPDANYGRSFARFEARFQLAWALGAFIPVILRLPITLGYLAVAGAAAFAGVSYLLGTRATTGTPIPGSGRSGDWAGRDGVPEGVAPSSEEAVPDAPVEPGVGDVVASAPPVCDPAPDEVGAADESADTGVMAPPHRWDEAEVVPVVTSVEGVEIDTSLARRRRWRRGGRNAAD